MLVNTEATQPPQLKLCPILRQMLTQYFFSGPNDCYEGNGESYRGNVSETDDGHECLYWNSHFILESGKNPFKSFENEDGLGPHNFCRSGFNVHKNYVYNFDNLEIYCPAIITLYTTARI